MISFKYLIIPFLTVFISQFIKFIIESIKNKRIEINRFLDGSGGIPSSHSAIVSSITTLVYLNYNADSVLFAICLIFSLIVLYDAMGVRYEAGKQAVVLNDIVDKLDENNKISLSEKIGHKPFEVLCGVILGIILALFFNKII